MANYKVFISTSAEKALSALPQRDIVRIISLIRSLGVNPRPQGCRKLSGRDDTYRVRLGVYRIIYDIHDDELTVLVLKVGHRKDVYR